MNPIFEPFVDFIAENSYLIDDSGKQHKDRFMNIDFFDLTDEELENLNLPDDNLQAIHVTFSSQRGGKYKAVHIRNEKKSYILLSGLDRNYNDFEEVSGQIAASLPARPEEKIMNRGDDICDIIHLKKQVTASQVSSWFQTFYSSVFDNASLAKAYYHDVLVDDFEKAQIPEDKVSKGDVKRPLENVMKRRELNRLCEEHAQKVNKKIKKENIIVIHLYHDELEFNKKREPAVDNLYKLLNEYDTAKFGLILIDSYDHYALQSHELVDDGRVSAVMFTEPNKGVFLHPKQVQIFKGTKKNYYGGTYGQQCVNTVVGSINRRKYITPGCFWITLRPINDAILWSEKVETNIGFGYSRISYQPYNLSLKERFNASRGVTADYFL